MTKASELTVSGRQLQIVLMFFTGNVLQNPSAFSIIKSCVVVPVKALKESGAPGQMQQQRAAAVPAGRGGGFVLQSNICQKESMIMTYSQQVQNMCPITKGPKHGPAPIPEEGAWVKAYEIKDISGYTHGVGWCAPQQGTCKLSLNIKNGVIEEALVETIGCSGMTHSAAMAGEILPGKTILEALNTDLVCDAINVAMRELFLQIVYGRSQTAFSEDGLPIGAGLDDLGKGLRSMTGTIFSTKAKGVRYLELTEGYINKLALDANDEVIGYQFVKLGKMMEDIRHGKTPNEAYEKNVGTYGRFSKEAGAVKYIDPREE